MFKNVKALQQLGVVACLALAFGFVGCSKDDRLAGHIEKANRAFERRDFEVAKIEYINTLRLQMTNTQAQLRLGKVFFEQGQMLQAFAFLTRSREYFPEDIELREQLATIYAGAPGETNRAIFLREVDEILQRNPTNETAVLLLGSAMRTPAELAATEAKVAALRAKHGDHYLYHIVDGTLAAARGDMTAAEASFKKATTLGPSAAVTHHIYANFLGQLGRREETETHLKKAYELASPHSPVRLAWAKFLFGASRFDESRAVLDELNSKAPERTSAWVARAELALYEGKTEEAEKALGRAAAQAPTDVDVLRTYAQLRVAQNRPAEAIKELERAEQLRPDSEILQLQIARAHLANKDSARAVVALQKAVQLRPNFAAASLLLSQLHAGRGAVDDAMAVLRDSIRQNPNYEPTYLQLARLQSASGRVEDAFNAMQVARSRFTNSFDVPLLQGLVLRQMNRPADARGAFETALKLSPTNNLAALEQLVLLDVAATNFPAALDRLQARLDKQPTQPLLWLIKCEVHQFQGDLAEAEKAARKAVELNPDSLNGYMSLARTLARSENRQNEALQELSTLLTRRPDDFGALVLSAEILQQRKDFAGAVQRYEKAIQSRPNNPYLYNNLAYLQSEQLGRYEDALRTAQRAREMAGNAPEIADTLGWIHFRLGQYPEALRLLTEASERLGSHAEAQYHLGMAHYMMGHETEALQALDLAVRSPMEFKDKQAARDYLAVLRTDPRTADANLLAFLVKRRQDAPNDLIALTRLAGVYEAKGEYPKALETLEEALKLNAKSPTVLARLGELHSFRLNNPTKGLELLRSARALAPADPEVAFTAGKAALQSGDVLWAAAALEDAGRKLTNRPDVSLQVAWAYLGLGRTPEAETVLRKLSTGNPANPATVDGRESLELLNIPRTIPPPPQAAAVVEQALKRNEKNPAALLAYAAIAKSQKRPADAMKACERILAFQPNWVPALRELAVLAADNPTDDTRGLDAATRARRSLPNDDVLAAALGKLAVRKGDHRYGAQTLNEAKRTQDADASLHFHLGLAQQALNQPAEARKSFQASLAKDPNGPHAAEAKSRLETLKEK